MIDRGQDEEKSLDLGEDEDYDDQDNSFDRGSESDDREVLEDDEDSPRDRNFTEEEDEQRQVSERHSLMETF